MVKNIVLFYRELCYCGYVYNRCTKRIWKWLYLVSIVFFISIHSCNGIFLPKSIYPPQNIEKRKINLNHFENQCKKKRCFVWNQILKILWGLINFYNSFLILKWRKCSSIKRFPSHVFAESQKKKKS